jgi:phosphatidylserine decarboxylase
MSDDDTTLFPSNRPEWRLLAAAGTIVGCLTAVWLPFGIIGFAGFLYLAVLLRPLAPVSQPDDDYVRAPVDGTILSVDTGALNVDGDEVTVICLRAGSFSSQLQSAPVRGIVDSVIWFAGVFKTEMFKTGKDGAQMSNAARREFIFETDSGHHIGFIQHGDSYARLLMGFVQEGQRLTGNEKIGVSLFHARLSIIVPAQFDIKVKVGQRILVGETVLASLVPLSAPQH